jgi:DNA-binding LacI/PurR family transcriptional regulator
MSDAMAIGAIHGVQSRGMRVPDDVSVVGFDDIEGAEYTYPALTTIHQPIAEKGAEAVRLLMAAIETNTEPPEHRRLNTRLVIRNSTTRPAAGRDKGQRQEVSPDR